MDSILLIGKLQNQSCLHPLTFLSVHEVQEPSSVAYNDTTRTQLLSRLDILSTSVKSELQRQGFSENYISSDELLNMRFDGTDTALMILPSTYPDLSPDDYLGAFNKAHKEQFGFVLSNARVLVDDLIVRGTGRTFNKKPESVHSEAERLRDGKRSVSNAKAKLQNHEVYFDGVGRRNVPVFVLGDLEVGEEVQGPAIVIDETQTIIITPNAKALVTSMQLYITLD